VPRHWPVTLPVSCIWLPTVWVNVIWLIKQQHDEVIRHVLSIWYVPIQLGVEEYIPFIKIDN
jgi:hypothetical protein